MPKTKSTRKNNHALHSKLFLPLLIAFIILATFFATSDFKLPSLAAKGGSSGGSQPPTNPTPTPVPGNLLTNSSFESYSGREKTPTNWVQHYDQPNKLAQTVCNDSHSGNCSYYVDGKHFNAIKQYVSSSVPAGGTITVSGWGKGQDVADNTNPATGSFWVQAWIHYTDGSIEYGLHADFDNGTHDYQFKEASFTVSKPVEGFTYFVKFGKTGYAWFDDVNLKVVTP